MFPWGNKTTQVLHVAVEEASSRHNHCGKRFALPTKSKPYADNPDPATVLLGLYQTEIRRPVTLRAKLLKIGNGTNMGN